MKKHFLLLLAAMAVNLCVMAQATYDTLYVYQDCDLNPKTLPGEFWVATGKKVRFSQGNLQFNCKSRKWRFATHQYDVLNELNSQVNDGADVWIDCFNFGTSGYGNKWPLNPADAFSGGDIIGSNSEYDWGVHNPIINGGNKAGLWRTLTTSEWGHLISANPRRYVRLDGKILLMLCPIGWTDAMELEMIGKNVYNGDQIVSISSITLNQANILEENGVVFLACGGSRGSGSKTFTPGEFYYWTATSGKCVSIQCKDGGCNYYKVSTALASGNTYGYSVRLVQDL